MVRRRRRCKRKRMMMNSKDETEGRNKRGIKWESRGGGEGSHLEAETGKYGEKRGTEIVI